jgi:hypothetical protein
MILYYQILGTIRVYHIQKNSRLVDKNGIQCMLTHRSFCINIKLFI